MSQRAGRLVVCPAMPALTGLQQLEQLEPQLVMQQRLAPGHEALPRPPLLLHLPSTARPTDQAGTDKRLSCSCWPAVSPRPSSLMLLPA